MTFFLPPQPKDGQTRPATNPAPAPTSGLLDVVGAAFDAEAIETDRLGRREAIMAEIVGEMEADAPTGFRVRDRSYYLGLGAPMPGEATLGRRRAADIVAEYARAANDPGAFPNAPKSMDELDAEINRRQRSELDEANDVIAMGGTGSSVAELLGRGAAGSTDETSLLMAPLGVTGGVGRVIAGEAVLGALGEVTILPKMFETAKRLNIPAPDPVEQVGLGFLFGGAIGGGVVGAQRGAAYVAGKRAQARNASPDGADPQATEASVEGAERALVNGADPMAANVDDAQSLAESIIGVESSGNTQAVNPSEFSTASGLGQFIESTWLETIQRHRPDLMQGRSQADVLALRFDGKIAREMTIAHTADNIRRLQGMGINPTRADIYLAHFAGAGGAARIISANPADPITRFFGEKAMEANANIRFAGKFFAEFTVADLRRWSEAKMGGLQDPASAYKTTTRRGYTTPDQVVTSAGRRVDVDYEVVDAADLEFASGDLQPRDRSRAASDEQISEIAAGLDPARLAPSPEADRGAPIIGPDGVIESGNGRIRAIVRAQEIAPDRYDAYVQSIRSGFDVPEGVTTPVLIARRKSDLSDADRVAFVAEANRAAVARFSATEQAGADGRLINDRILALHEPASPLGSAGNRAFTNAFLANLPQAERASLVTANGALNSDGDRRIAAALFSRAYGAPDLIARTFEADAPEVRAAARAMTDAASDWAAFRNEINSGAIRPEMDVTDQLLSAVRLIADARQKASSGDITVGAAIRDALAQGDLLDGAPDPVLSALVNVFYDGARARSGEAVTDMLRRYLAEARLSGSSQAGLFGDALDIAPADILASVTRGEAAPQAQAAPLNGFGDGASSDVAKTADDAAEAALRAPDAQSPGNAARDEIAEAAADGDFTFRDLAGAEMSSTELLDDLGADAEFADVLDVCVSNGGRA